MSKKDGFNYNLNDSQATKVEPVRPEDFDFQAYADYEQELQERCRSFWQGSEGGVLVYRRMRVAEVFSYGCRNMRDSLAWQLGALAESMKFKADVPNFLEPWYGIGTVASAYGFDYTWHPGQAPAVDGKFSTTSEALEYPVGPVAETPIGKHTLAMAQYFLEETGGKLPMSYCDVQSPLNVAGNIIDTSNFMTDFYMDPETVQGVLDTMAGLLVDFTREQAKLIGDAVATPGHGFASSREFDGFGMSDDNIVMLSDDLYSELVVPSVLKCAKPFGGPVLHSCGNWAQKVPVVVQIPGLKMVDAAFSPETDPDPNNPSEFISGFENTGIVVNARIVGGYETVENVVSELWRPGLKLIVVTYSQSPGEQEKVYDAIHAICR